jgi:DNA-binding GntR family transcriptional regulator
VPVRPIQIASVVDQVHAALREQILSGELERGSRLPQETLAAELGVSRTPLREALRRLAGEGLVTLQPNYGATVAQLDFGDMRDAWTARLVIEPPAARLGAERRPQAELERMQAAIDAQRAHGDPASSLDANREFHLALVATSGNPHLIHLAELLWVARISRLRWAAPAPGRTSTTASWRRCGPATRTRPSGSRASTSTGIRRWLKTADPGFEAGDRGVELGSREV